ncbi:MAG: hypothetical protein JO061_14750 [Acidobacteriaceae bacterium]|nr:hypothetical protein [Acidobacteriaceae bacterium]
MLKTPRHREFVDHEHALEQHAPSETLLIDRITAGLSRVILVVGCCTFLATVWIVVRTYSPVLFWDHWDIIRELFQNHTRITVGELWAQHNEHRILLGRLLFYADLFWFGGTNKSLLVEIIAAQLFLLAVFVWAIVRFGAVSKPTLWTAIGLLTYCCFSPLQINNFVWPFQITFVMSGIGPITCFAAAVEYSRTPASNNRRRTRLILLCIASALFAEGTLASGLLVWPLLCALALILRFLRRHQALVAGTAMVGIAAYLIKYQAPLGVSDPLETIKEPGRVLGFVLTELAWSWDQSVPNASAWPTLSEELAFIAIAASIAAVMYYVLNPRREPLYVFLVVSILYAIAAVTLTALGRLRFGLSQATESRYQSLALLFWALMVVLCIVWFDKQGKALLAVQVGCLLLFMGGASRFVHMLHWAEGQQDGLGRAWRALITSSGDPAARVLYYDFPMLRVLAAHLHEHHWGPQEGKWAYSVPTLIVEPSRPSASVSGFSIAAAQECSGFIDGAELTPDLHHVTVQGWAWENTTASLPSVVILASENGQPAGSAQLGLARPDVIGAVHRITSSNTGWRVTIVMPSKRGVYHAFAIGQEHKSACELSNELNIGSLP